MQIKLKMLLSAIFFLNLLFITSDVQAAPGRDTNQNGNGAKVQGNAIQAHPYRAGKSRHHQTKRLQNYTSGSRRCPGIQAFARALRKGGILTIQQAWDVAYFYRLHELQQDPHDQGNLKLSENALSQHACR